jgi:hypothetical protein
MILGMTVATYTLIHVIISLAGIVSGLVAVLGWIAGKRLPRTTTIFLITTIATSVTGFGFPIHKIGPPHILGALSLIVLTIALIARSRSWKTFVITSVIALYFNAFVGVVQAFEKIDALHALAPTQKEPPFAIAQGLVLILFLVLGVLATKRKMTFAVE